MEQASLRTVGALSGNALKMIAVITMFIDHIGAGIIEPYILQNYAALAARGRLGLFLVLNAGFRIIGRIAFPIFCFLLVEGFQCTRDVKKYGLRLLLFGLISEIPFDLLFYNSFLYPGHQNVYFTLFLGLAVLAGYRHCGYDWVKKILVAAAGCVAAYVLRCDYDAMGILMIVVLYELREAKLRQMIAGAIMAALESILSFCAAALAFLPISMYNGTRGRLNLKFLFYWFYPLHLLGLYLVRLMIDASAH